MKIKKYIHLTFKTSSEITDLYRSLQVDYLKFFKMDGLSKLGFLASEMIFKEEENRFIPREDIAIICFNSASSLDIDVKYEETICNKDNYFPSPSLFVYTLPNIVTGEIAIRNKFFGETFYYNCKLFDAKQIVRVITNTFQDKNTNTILATWIEYFEEKKEVFMMLIENEKGDIEFNEEQVSKLYNK